MRKAIKRAMSKTFVQKWTRRQTLSEWRRRSFGLPWLGDQLKQHIVAGRSKGLQLWHELRQKPMCERSSGRPWHTIHWLAEFGQGCVQLGRWSVVLYWGYCWATAAPEPQERSVKRRQNWIMKSSTCSHTLQNLQNKSKVPYWTQFQTFIF